MKRSLKILAGVVTAAALVAVPMTASAEDRSIAEVATEAGDFETLVTAVGAAGLAETLSDCEAGPFTVFAPVDAAFEALVEAGVDVGAIVADTALLTDILTYHVVEGAVDSTTVVGLTEATMLNGGTVTIAVDGETVTLNDSVTVTAVDIEACNGIIHVIDAVLVPPGAEVPMVATDDAPEEETLVTVGSNSGLVAGVAALVLLGGVGLMFASRRRLHS